MRVAPLFVSVCLVFLGQTPLPARTDPGAESSQQKPGRPPSDAIILFDGTNLDQWATVAKGVAGPAKWKVEAGYMEVAPGAGAIYNHQPPLVDACRKPGEWQIYDIVFQAPEFDGEKLVKPPYVTVFYNGVVIHHHLRISGRYDKGGTYKVQGSEDSILLQNQ